MSSGGLVVSNGSANGTVGATSIQVTNFTLTSTLSLGGLTIANTICIDNTYRFVGLGVYTPTLRDQIRVLESEGPGSEDYRRLAARGRNVGIALAIIVVIIVYLMVAKPA